MLFEFLHELRAGIFNNLPFVLQMRIARFIPNLPALHLLQKNVLRLHHEKRYCVKCGNPLSFCHKPSFCLCKKQFTIYKYRSPVRPYKVYKRPLQVIQEPLIRPIRLFLHHYLQEGRYCYVASNQPESLYSISYVLDSSRFDRYRLFCGDHIERLYKKTVRYMINANTCIKSFSDLFGTLQTVYENDCAVKTRQVFRKTMTQNPKVLTKFVLDHYLHEKEQQLSIPVEGLVREILLSRTIGCA